MNAFLVPRRPSGVLRNPLVYVLHRLRTWLLFYAHRRPEGCPRGRRKAPKRFYAHRRPEGCPRGSFGTKRVAQQLPRAPIVAAQPFALAKRGAFGRNGVATIGMGHSDKSVTPATNLACVEDTRKHGEGPINNTIRAQKSYLYRRYHIQKLFQKFLQRSPLNP